MPKSHSTKPAIGHKVIKQGLRYEPWGLPRRPGETDDELRDRRNLAYFEWQLSDSIPEWWSRVPPPDFTGARVLDVGCGHGSLVFDIVRRGASRVVGIDLDSERIEFANRHIKNNLPEIASKVTFLDTDIAELNEKFDFVVSKDTFEHVQDLRSMMKNIHRLLEEGGKLIIGTSPLYYSPYGDHHLYWGKRLLPWLPVFIPEPILFRLAKWRTGVSIKSASDVGLNKLTPSQFRDLLDPELWDIEICQYNAGRSTMLKPMRLLRKVPLLEPYFTTSIYAVLRKAPQKLT